MGLWDQVKREVGKVVREASSSSSPPGSGAGADPREPVRGPDPGALVSPDEIEAATGSRPLGEGDRRSGGQDLDTGFFRVCIWPLADGGELLVNSTRLRDAEGVALWRSRWDDPSWQDVDDEQPLPDVGEAARWYVTRSHRGGTELHVAAKDGMFTAQLVHTSPAGATDVTPLAGLMGTLLSRLRSSERD